MTPDEALQARLRFHLDQAANTVAARARMADELADLRGLPVADARAAVEAAFSRMQPGTTEQAENPTGFGMNGHAPPDASVSGQDLVLEVKQLRALVKQLVPIANGEDAPPAVSEVIGQQIVHEYAVRAARRQVDALEYAQAAGERRFLPFAEVEKIPQPRMLLNGMLTCGGFYGLAGPPEAGKSLMLRDWLCHLASQGTPCLYAVSEGLFDLIDRFGAHHSYAAARANLKFFDGPLNLSSVTDVRWLAERLDGCGLVALDMAYGFGLPDDDGTKGIAPFITGCKELARSTGACVVVTGHPGHNGERRFRGSSMWRGAFDGEFHMAGGQFSCEKHKYADKRRFNYPYAISYPHLRTLGTTGQLDRAASRMQAVDEDRRMYPHDSDSARSKRLAGQLGMQPDSVRKMLREFRQAQADD